MKAAIFQFRSDALYAPLFSISEFSWLLDNHRYSSSLPCCSFNLLSHVSVDVSSSLNFVPPFKQTSVIHISTHPPLSSIYFPLIRIEFEANRIFPTFHRYCNTVQNAPKGTRPGQESLLEEKTGFRVFCCELSSTSSGVSRLNLGGREGGPRLQDNFKSSIHLDVVIPQM